jgi:hypothetical protein
MKIETLELLAEKADNIGVYALVRKQYSGRGMYGKTVPAIVVARRATFLRLALLVGDELKHADETGDKLINFLEDIAKYTVDNMGRDFIFY